MNDTVIGWLVLLLAGVVAYFLWSQKGQPGATVGDITDATKKWVNQPFNSKMNLWFWILFVGVLSAAAGLWSRVLAHIGE